MTVRTPRPRATGALGPPPPDDRARGTVRRDLVAVRVVAERELIRGLRSPLQVVLTLLHPLLFLVVLGTGLSRAVPDLAADYRAFLFPGMLVMAVQFPAVAVGASILWDREMRFLREMLVAPVRREALLAGKCLGGTAVGACTGGVLLALAGVAGVPYDPVLLAALLAEMALAAFALTTLGALCAVHLRRLETFQTVLSLAMLPLLFLSGAFFPLHALPAWLAVPALVNPLTYAVDALRRTMAAFDAGTAGTPGPMWGSWQPTVATELGVVLLLAVAALALAARRFGRPA